MATDNISKETVKRIWDNDSGRCFEIAQDADGLGLVQIRHYSTGILVGPPDSEMVMTRDEFEAFLDAGTEFLDAFDNDDNRRSKT